MAVGPTPSEPTSRGVGEIVVPPQARGSHELRVAHTVRDEQRG